jgi:hypothetical protein
VPDDDPCPKYLPLCAVLLVLLEPSSEKCKQQTNVDLEKENWKKKTHILRCPCHTATKKNVSSIPNEIAGRHGLLTRKAAGPAVEGFEKRDDRAKASAAEEHIYIQSITRT